MWPRTLRSRLVLFFALLLALAESTVLVLVDGAASRISRHEVEAGLQAGEAVFQRLLLAQNRLRRFADDQRGAHAGAEPGPYAMLLSGLGAVG